MPIQDSYLIDRAIGGICHAAFHTMWSSRYGPLSRSPSRAFDTGLRPDPFPDQAASLLPGLLTATGTGLTPASDDELTTKDHLHKVTSDLLVARKIEASPRSWGFLVPLIADPMPQSL